MGLLINTTGEVPLWVLKRRFLKVRDGLLASILKAIRTKEGFEGVE